MKSILTPSLYFLIYLRSGGKAALRLSAPTPELCGGYQPSAQVNCYTLNLFIFKNI
jgi:hypothetical protein